MLKRKWILRGKKNFDKVKSEGYLRWKNSIGLIELKTEDELKIGVIVSKKVDKLAVVRNKIRRIIMKILGDHLEKIEKNKWVVVLAKRESIRAKEGEITMDLKSLWGEK